MTTALQSALAELYGEAIAQSLLTKIDRLVAKYPRKNETSSPPDETTMALICYGDSFQSSGQVPLKVLNNFLINYLGDTISTVHLLPFFPYSSDDGFSVIDYKAVNPVWGAWSDIDTIGERFGLMFDAVVNHISVQSEWFSEYLNSNPEYADFFLETEPGTDLRAVTRARSHPLLTAFQRDGKTIHLWTTFSTDQIDLNFRNPEVLLRMLDVLLFYAARSVKIIRLDAIGHAWKEPGTSCLNLRGAHLLVQIFRAVLDRVFPDVLLLTETNVPHVENIRYFGDGRNEAQLIYQFPLTGLLVHSFQCGNAVKLTRWAQTLELNSDSCTYFNLLASHDGIGVRPLLGILDETEIATLVERTQNHGGYISYKTAGEGASDPYEMNITLFDIIADSELDEDTNIRRFLTAQAILLAMPGIPALYYHSLFGSSGDNSTVEKTGLKRAVNRRKFNLPDLEKELADPHSRTARIFSELKNIIAVRKNQPAFNPYCPAKIISLTEQLFTILRTTPDQKTAILAIHNLSAQTIRFRIPIRALPVNCGSLKNLFTGEKISISETIGIAADGFTWLGYSG